MVDSKPDAIGIALKTIGLAPFRNLIMKKIAEVEDDFHPVYMVYKTGAYKTRAVENFIEFVRSFKWTKE